ncbi:MAG: LON peptidase substrate-binding domain-containing protein, partial [Deltaproteobacteria bacterium]|nr:LON peptidase substrate-binding domain-containing protein [Deltaproteobacteria bacterium]
MSRNNVNSQKIYSLPPLAHDLEYDKDKEAELFKVPDTVRLLPMVEMNSFPRLVSNIAIEDPKVLEYLNNGSDDHVLGLFALKNLGADPQAFSREDFHQVGVAARVLSVEESESESDSLRITVLGLSRVNLEEVSQEGPMARVTPIEESQGADEELRPLVLEAKRLFGEIIMLMPGTPLNFFKINRVLE